MHHLSKGLDIYMNKYDNIIFLGQSDSETSENYLNHFRNVYNLWNIVKEPNCFKNPHNPSCIDRSAVLSKYSCSRNKYFRLSQNGSCGIESFLQETKTKSHSTQKLR